VIHNDTRSTKCQKSLFCILFAWDFTGMFTCSFFHYEIVYLVYNILLFYLFNYLFIYFLPACEFLIISRLISSLFTSLAASLLIIYTPHNNFFSELYNVCLSKNFRFPRFLCTWPAENICLLNKNSVPWLQFSSAYLSSLFFIFFVYYLMRFYFYNTGQFISNSRNSELGCVTTKTDTAETSTTIGRESLQVFIVY
jgi:hypothetical protein